MYKHEFALDKDGDRVENEYADMHPEWYCLRCGWTMCYLCDDVENEPCDNQDTTLF